MARRPRTPATRGERRRAAFLAAGTQVFLERGFAAATLDDVIRQSGGSRATLYTQFGSKEGLFAAIIAELCERITSPLDGESAEPADVPATLEAFGAAYLAVLMAPESLALYRVVIGESGRFPALGAAVFQAGPTIAADRLAAYLRREVERGRLRLADCAAAARYFLEMVKGDLHLRALMDPPRAPSASEIDWCIQRAVALFLDGARPR